MDTNKKNEASSSSFDDIEKKIHANQVLYDQLHQSLVDESISQVDENEKSGGNNKSEISAEDSIFSKLSTNPGAIIETNTGIKISIIIVKNNKPRKRRLKISLANLFACFLPLVISDE